MQSVLCVASRYPGGSLVPSKNKELKFSGSLLKDITVLVGEILIHIS